MLIGLAGKKGCGKSAMSSHLVGRYDFELIKFAGPLKKMMAALGLTDHEIEGHLKEEPCALLHGKTPRYAMQTIGTEWGRHMIHPDIWITAWKRLYDIAYSLDKDVVVDDVRFPNEASCIWKSKGIILEIVRPNPKEIDDFSKTHASEQFNFDPNFVVNNDGTLDDLYRKVCDLTGLR